MHFVVCFSLDDNVTILLVDANNAFYSLNRYMRPFKISEGYATPYHNFFKHLLGSTELIVDGDAKYSEEGTSQGGLLAIPMYALATIPRIKKVEGSIMQAWCSDDWGRGGGGGEEGEITDVCDWWDRTDLQFLTQVMVYFHASKTYQREYTLKMPLPQQLM